MPATIRKASLAAVQASPSPLYLVTYDHYDRTLGRITGTADIGLNDQNRAHIAREIAKGHIEGVEQILECVPGEPCRDITEDIARDVFDLVIADGETIDRDIQSFIETHIGCEQFAEALRERAA